MCERALIATIHWNNAVGSTVACSPDVNTLVFSFRNVSAHMSLLLALQTNKSIVYYQCIWVIISPNLDALPYKSTDLNLA